MIDCLHIALEDDGAGGFRCKNCKRPHEGSTEGIFVVHAGNIEHVFEQIKQNLRDTSRILPPEFTLYVCGTCRRGMLTQPAAMVLLDSGPVYYCWDHAPKW